MKKLSELSAKIIKFTAKAGAGAASLGGIYEPELPKELQDAEIKSAKKQK